LIIIARRWVLKRVVLFLVKSVFLASAMSMCTREF